MRRLLITACLGLTMGCAGLNTQGQLMPIIGIVWSTQITPLILEEIPNLSQVEQQAIIAAASRVQSILDSGDVSSALDIHELWNILRPVAEATIQSRVDSGRLGPNGALLLQEMLRQFELNLAKLAVPSAFPLA